MPSAVPPCLRVCPPWFLVFVVLSCSGDRSTDGVASAPGLSLVAAEPVGDPGPNEWGSFGPGESQAARLADGDDATFIRTAEPGRVSCVAVDAARRGGVRVIRSVTLCTRESHVINGRQLRRYQIYVDGWLHFWCLAFRTHAPGFGEYWTRIGGPDNGFSPIVAGESTRIAIGFDSIGLEPGERWAISMLRVEFGCQPPAKDPGRIASSTASVQKIVEGQVED